MVVAPVFAADHTPRCASEFVYNRMNRVLIGRASKDTLGFHQAAALDLRR